MAEASLAATNMAETLTEGTPASCVERGMSRTLAKPQVRRSGPERGMALVLVLLIVVLLYILVAEVVTTSSFDVMTSQNQAQETGIRAALRLALTKAKEELTDDSSGSGSGGAGGAGGGLGGAGGAGGGLRKPRGGRWSGRYR